MLNLGHAVQVAKLVRRLHVDDAVIQLAIINKRKAARFILQARAPLLHVPVQDSLRTSATCTRVVAMQPSQAKQAWQTRLLKQPQ
jgi:hypothetical protein